MEKYKDVSAKKSKVFQCHCYYSAIIKKNSAKKKNIL